MSYRKRLEELVGIDSGSGDLAGLRLMAERVGAFLDEAGMTVELVPAAGPDAVVGRVRGTGRGRVLLAGHLDTVFPAGTAAARPFTVDDVGIARGPGVCDDVGGVLAGIAAVESLRDSRSSFGEIVLVATPDEEIGSPGCRDLLAELGSEADVVLGLECARADGALVSGRKGVADVAVTVQGRAAHAGIEPGAGVSAALAVARLALAVDGLNGRWADVTVNAGVLRAGERPNIVAAQGTLVAEVRASDPAHFEAALAAIEAIVAAERGVRCTVDVEAPVPPWAAADGTRRLLAVAREVGAEVGVDVRHVVTGGCGDANLLAVHCDAVLDGLGPVGGNDHGPDEYLDLRTVAPRVALLAGLVHRADRVVTVQRA